MKDKIIRALGAKEEWLGVAVDATESVETARVDHHSSPLAAKRLGELMMGALLKADNLKGDNDKLTLQIRGNGDLGKAIVTCDSHGHVKGYVENPNGKSGLGNGYFTIIQDMGLREPYTSTIPCLGDNVAKTLSDFYEQSDQLDAKFAFGVKLDKEGKVVKALGYMTQALPFGDKSIALKISENFAKMPPMASLLESDATPEQILDLLFAGLDKAETSVKDVAFYCDCSKQRTGDILASIGKDELQSIIDDGRPVELECGWCGKKYSFSIDEIKAIKGGLGK